jgi:hypothetical protein
MHREILEGERGGTRSLNVVAVCQNGSVGFLDTKILAKMALADLKTLVLSLLILLHAAYSGIQCMSLPALPDCLNSPN